MKRLLALGAGAAVLLGVVLVSNLSSDPAPDTAPTRLETASLTTVDVLPQPRPLPKPKFTRTMFAYVNLPGVDVALDACGGPVAVDIGKEHSVLIAEHDYCGGSAWVPKLRNDDAVLLKGDGVKAGTYVVTEIRFQPRNADATVGDLPQTDAVLQTCISKTEMILVGLDRLDLVTVTS